MPRYCGLEGNEHADEEAKGAAQEPQAHYTSCLFHAEGSPSQLVGYEAEPHEEGQI